MSNAPKKHVVSGFLKAITLTTIIVLILGYVDHITGEVSIEIFYIFCICLATWYGSTLIGLLCITEILLAKITADHYGQIAIGSELYWWNALSYIIVYVIICLLVGNLKKALSK